MNLNTIIGITAVAAMVALIGGALLYRRWRIAHLPRSWRHNGTPPPDVDLAFEVMYEEYMAAGIKIDRWGGICNWVDGLFWVDTLKLWCAGIVVSRETPEYTLTKYATTDLTALVHEDVHVRLNVEDSGTSASGLPTLPPDALALAYRINAKIRARREATV